MNGLPRHTGAGAYCYTEHGEDTRYPVQRPTEPEYVTRIVSVCPICGDEFLDEDECRDHLAECEEWR